MMTIGIVTVRNNSETLAMVKSMLPALRPNWTGVECEMVTINRPDEDAVTLALKVRPVYMRIIVR
jgi:multimeric flavodoxin WrbA